MLHSCYCFLQSTDEARVVAMEQQFIVLANECNHGRHRLGPCYNNEACQLLQLMISAREGQNQYENLHVLVN